jgi:DNA-binding NarL/FixJ family response regulator
MRVLLVDDNLLMLEGLQNLLELHDIQVVGIAQDGLKALALAERLKPDVILMDIRMPGCDGLTATRLIKAKMPEMKIVILTTSTEDQDLFESVKSGAMGYLLKSMDAEGLIEALEQVREGIPPFSPGLAGKLLEEFRRLTNQAVAPKTNVADSQTIAGSGLNPRQTEVLRLVSEGLSYKEIGVRLHLSPRTTKYHMAEIMNKLHLENRAQVLAYAGQLGLRYDNSE